MPSPTHDLGARDNVSSESLLAFGEDLSRYGPVLAAWPVESRERAERILATSQVARADLADAGLVEEFLGQRQTNESGRDLAARIIAAQQALAPAVPCRQPHAFVAWQAAFVIAMAAVGLISGRWMMPAQADYDVSSIFMICTDAFYL